MNENFSWIEFAATQPFAQYEPERSLLDFIQTGSMDVIKNFQIPPRDDFGRHLAMALWGVTDWGPAEEASLRFVALLALIKGGPGKEKFEVPLSSTYGHLIHYCRSSDILQGIDLFGTLKEVGFDAPGIISLHFKTFDV